MSHSQYLADVKLCLDILSRFQIYPNLEQLEQFLADESLQQLLNQSALTIKTEWEQRFLDNQQQSVAEAIPAPSPALLISEPVNLEKTASEPAAVSEANETETDIQQEDVVNLTPQTPQKTQVRFKLANATVGRTYQSQLEWPDTENIKVLTIDGLEDLGLCYDAETNSLSGEPEKAGEHRLIIHYQANDNNEASSDTAELNLVINNDPKSLWKNIPSDDSVPFWKADVDYQGQEGLYDWKVAAASKRGRSHAHVGSCRDDDFALQINKESLWHIVAVADGAGSSEFSREGARIIAHNSAELLNQQLQETAPNLDKLIASYQQKSDLDSEIALHIALVEVFKVALSDSIHVIEALADQKQASYRDFYSTLLIAAHKPLPEGQFVACYWIGDGALGLYKADQTIELLGEGDSGEYAGQTRFLDKSALELDDFSQRVRFSLSKTFTALVLMTDGISDPLFETDNNLRDSTYWQNVWQQIQPLLSDNPQLSAEKLTDWLDFWSPGNHDDRTIALIYR